MSAAGKCPEEAVVIGASMGAIEALSIILPALPCDYPLPVLIVVHVPRHKKSVMADLFSERCPIRVKEAEDKEPLQPSTVYFAPSDYHLLVENDLTLSLSSDEPVHFSRPSIDVLFQTAADAFGDRLTGVILTGSSSDGAEGLRAVLDAGGRAIVQNPGSAEGKAMPLAALEACPGATSMLLGEIAASLVNPK